MKRNLEKYVIEITIVLLGAIAAVFEAIFAARPDTALIVVLVALLLALAVTAIKQEIAVQIGDAFAETRIIDAIPDSRWRKEASMDLEQLKLTFSTWANGTRRIPVHSSLNFQIDSVSSAEKSIQAVHIAFDPGALQIWDDRHRGYDRLVDTFRELDDRIVKQRILVLNSQNDGVSIAGDKGRLIVDEVAIRVCRLQTSLVADGGLGFELRVLWLNKADDLPPNLLIVDEREVCSIENLGNDRFTDLEVKVNPTLVQMEIRRFKDLWTSAIPLQHCLPNE